MSTMICGSKISLVGSHGMAVYTCRLVQVDTLFVDVANDACSNREQYSCSCRQRDLVNGE